MYTIAVTIFTILLVITIHEYGHFWVARRCGVQVLRFAVGFGKPLWRWRDQKNTEFVLASIPLGGYVQMLDERTAEIPPELEHLAFNRKPVLTRIAVVVAGPLANLLLAVVAYWFVFLAGETGPIPIIGPIAPDSVAERAGLESGQEIVAVDGHATPTWQAVNFRLLDRIGDTGQVEFSLRNPGSDVVYQASGSLTNWMSGDGDFDLLGGLGIRPERQPISPLLDTVVAGSPADLAGLQAGDRIVRADGEPVPEWQVWVEYVRARPGQRIALQVERNGDQFETSITPARKLDSSGSAYGQVGVTVRPPQWPPHKLREFHYGPVEALVLSTRRTWDLTVFTFQSIGKMLRGLISHQNLSGPITIARVASDSAQSGLQAYVAFVALLSVSLGVLNLLPIPVLDGGHLLYCVIELVVGRPVPLKVQVLGYQLGLLVIFGVMALALFNDFSRL